uniref:Endonuclease/exonuclease/phosphatase domain-containing protein n=1 Tax=Lepisosteus oculatus TaxID=7918 RepID=W5MP57_LEPOC
MTFSIATVNVRGLRERNKRVAVFKELARRRFDICFLQEVHMKDSTDVGTFKREWSFGHSWWSVGGVNSSGVGILCSGYDFVVQTINSVVLLRASFLSELLEAEQEGIVQKNIYGDFYNRFVDIQGIGVKIMDRKNYWTELFPLCATNRFLVIGGDFDVDLINKEEAGAKQLRTLLTCFNLVDSAVRFQAKGVVPTWRNTAAVAKRLEYVFVSREVAVGGVTTHPACLSDHDIVEVDLSLARGMYGKGVWRMNVEVLEEREYVDRMSLNLNRWREERQQRVSTLDWWEQIKRKIKRETRLYCLERQKKKKRWEDCIVSKLPEKSSGVERMGLKTSENQIAALLKQIRKHHERRAREFLFRARVEFLDHYETCSKYFFNRIRKRQEKRVFHSILATSGKQVTDQDGMLREAARFYEELFAEKVCEREAAEEVLQTLQATLTEEERDNLGKPFELSELEAAMKSLKKGKVPGVDGIPVEFYRTFWPILGPFLLEVMGEIFSKKSMGKSMREGILTLVFKKGDRTELKNWRPLTLLCVDYKIIAKLLVHRLSRVMTNVIGRDQTCGVKGR